eukprot:scpid78602/ scgid12293/ 
MPAYQCSVPLHCTDVGRRRRRSVALRDPVIRVIIMRQGNIPALSCSNSPFRQSATEILTFVNGPITKRPQPVLLCTCICQYAQPTSTSTAASAGITAYTFGYKLRDPCCSCASFASVRDASSRVRNAILPIRNTEDTAYACIT